MPKILFITADQWRADCLGHLGHPCLQTPNLDGLAADGVSFTRHFAQCSPCGPGRASLHTGMYLMNHRSVANGVPLDARFTNLALEMGSHGLECALLGFTDMSIDPRGLDPGDPRLRTYTGIMPGYTLLVPDSESPIAWIRHLGRLGYDVEVPFHPEHEPTIWEPQWDFPGARERGATFAPTRYSAAHSDTAFAVDHAIDYIARKASGDWFLHLSLLRPHPPFIAPEPYHARYEPHEGPEFLRHTDETREAAAHPYAELIVADTRDWVRKHRLDMSTDTYRRQLRATYWGMISEVDAHLGRLFQALRDSGDYDDTLIVFTSDHGEQLWDHWAIGKRSFYDQSFHVPLIVRAPHTPPQCRGRVVEHFTENVDIMPTILDAAGRPVPAQCDGISLMPWLQGRTPERWRDFAFYEMDFRDIQHGSTEHRLGVALESCSFAVLRGSDYKYVHFPTLPALLFNLREDPAELRDLARDPASTTITCELAQRMLSHRMHHAERTLTGMFLSAEKGVIHAEESRRRHRFV